MCMSVPGRVIEVRGGMAEVEIEGRRRWFNALMAPDVKPGTWVLTHTSLVLSEVSENEAEAIRSLLRDALDTDA